MSEKLSTSPILLFQISINLQFDIASESDSLDIEPVQNLQYLWVSPGERFDILYHLPEDVTGDAIKVRFLGFTSQTNDQTAWWMSSVFW